MLLKVAYRILFVFSLQFACHSTSPKKAPEPWDVPPSPAWVKDAVFYQIWPRSFQDSDADGHGDFRGLTDRLPYLNELGVNAIWLTPFFDSPSYHGYDIRNHYKVDTHYGSDQDLERFLSEAKKRNIRVLADLVLNHVSSQHPWFQKSERRDPEYDRYFIWRKERPAAGWIKPWDSNSSPKDVWHWSEIRQEYYYGVFSQDIPDLNLTHPAVVAELKKVAAYWLARGVSGFRLDAARYMIETQGGVKGQADTAETLDFLQDFRKYVLSIDPEVFLVGEVWADLPITARYHQSGLGINAVFDFDLASGIVKGLGGDQPIPTFGSLSGKDGGPLQRKLAENIRSKNSAGIDFAFYSPFLTNHDQDRIMRLLGNDPFKMRVAATILLTFVGSPFLYYGEEIGMLQMEAGDDLYKRSPMLWDDSVSAGFSAAPSVWIDDPRWFPWRKQHLAWWSNSYALGGPMSLQSTVVGQQNDEGSLLQHYRKMIALRHAHPELRSHGPESIEFLEAPETAVYYSRREGEQQTRLAINLADQEELVLRLPDSRRYRDLLSGREFQGPELRLKAKEIVLVKALSDFEARSSLKRNQQ